MRKFEERSYDFRVQSDIMSNRISKSSNDLSGLDHDYDQVFNCYFNHSIVVNAQIVNIYIGPFDNSTMDLIDYFAGNIATSNWYTMFRAYNRDVSGKKHHVVDAMFKERWAFLSTVQSMELTDRFLQELILPNILQKGLQSCTNCIYNIIFYGNLTMSGWNRPSNDADDRFCSYHTSYEYAEHGFQAAVVVVGDPTTSDPPNQGCIGYSAHPTANRDFSADSIVNTLAHALAEAIIDPLRDSRFFGDGAGSGCDISDLCNFDFGTTENFNIAVGEKKFLVQKLWQPVVGCSLGHTPPNSVAGAAEKRLAQSNTGGNAAWVPTMIPTMVSTNENVSSFGFRRRPTKLPTLTPSRKPSVKVTSSPTFTQQPSSFRSKVPVSKSPIQRSPPFSISPSKATLVPSYASKVPTTKLSATPSSSRTIIPSSPRPSEKPTVAPTKILSTSTPSVKPSSAVPTRKPTTKSAARPVPTILPQSTEPTPSPSTISSFPPSSAQRPTTLPLIFPTFKPFKSVQPPLQKRTLFPTRTPTQTWAPTISLHPSTIAPTEEPTGEPTAEPTFTRRPSRLPTESPTTSPSELPTVTSTAKPSRPTARPTSRPSKTAPTKRPTARPSEPASPTEEPSFAPTEEPTVRSTVVPSASARTSRPSRSPTRPTAAPTAKKAL